MNVTSKKRQAVGYVRVSTSDQAENGISLEAQKARIQAWCELSDFELVDVHIDAGLSGKRADNRPGLQAAISQACDSGAALVVYSLSRFARSTKDTLALSEQLERSSADLVSLSEKIDTTSAAGKMVFRMLAVLAEFERDVIAERTKTAMQHMKSQGRRFGAAPFGWDLEEDGETLIANPDEQEALSLIKDLRHRGVTLRAIATELNDRGVITKQGNKVWKHSTVAAILARAA